MIEFLRWATQADANTSLAAVEAIYELPYSDGDYVMNDWASVTQSDTTGEWGFYKPQVMLGKLQVDLMAACEAGYTETANIPDDWVDEGGGDDEELSFQQGVDSYTGAASVTFGGLLSQLTTEETHYMRYGVTARYHNLEHFELGDLSSYGDVISATLTLYNVGGNVYTESDVYVRQILDPDDLGSAYATGWEIGEGFRNGANSESRDDSTSTDIKWQNSDPGSPEDLGAHYITGVLKASNELVKYHPTDTPDEEYDIDVTDDVAEWKSGATPNQGWCLYHGDDVAQIIDVTATSNYTADVTKRPRLVIIFDGS